MSEACYVYGIVPADVKANPGVKGVGDPPGEIDVVRHGEIAALVSDVRTDRPLGRPEDLMAHEQLLDATAPEAPVLPIRFGAVLTDRKAVVEELLAPHEEEFAAALRELEGRAQYVVKGRYVERRVLSEVLSEFPEAAELREQISGKPEEATHDLRIHLGEMINNAVAAKREQDTQAVLDAVGPFCVSTAVREPTHELDAVHVALLVETARQRDLEDALDDLAQQWEGRVNLRLLGPLAPYDFVVTPQSAG